MTQGNEQSNETIWAGAEDLVIRKLMPGILLVFTVHIRGGKVTRRENLKVEYQEIGGKRKLIKTWDGREEWVDEVEWKSADAIKSDVRRKIEGLGIKTPVGLIIPLARQKELAEKLVYCRKRVDEANEEFESCNLVFSYCPYESESSNKAAIAAINESLNGILDTINEATKADDEKILAAASAADMKDPTNPDRILTTQQVLDGDADRRRIIVARARARAARNAIKKAKNYSSLLPEETGRAVDDLVKHLRKQATEWIAASKKSDEEYEEAMGAVDSAGISDMQAALVMAAAKADRQVQDATEAVDQGDSPGFLLGSGGNDNAEGDGEGEGFEPSPFLGAALALDSNDAPDEA